MASRRFASAITLSAGTKMNSGSLSTNFLISHGQATRSTLTFSRVIHFIVFPPCAFKTTKPLARQSPHQLVDAIGDEVPSDIEVVADRRTLVPALFRLGRCE